MGHGIYDASSDPARVRELFEAAPWATGYGIACGRAPHFLIGIDLDTKHGLDGISAMGALAEHHGFVVPETVTVRTPSGGLHLWLAGPEGVTVPNSVGRPGGRLAPGIDVRGSGGYLVGPGSVTTRGRYTLAPGRPGLPAAPVPPPLLALLVSPRPVRPERPARVSDRQTRALVRFVRNAAPGHRNDRLFWAACRAHETGVGAELEPDLIDAAVHTGLTEREALATVGSAARHTRDSHRAAAT